MKNAAFRGFLHTGLPVVGAILICAGPCMAQRARAGNTTKDDSRPASRPEARTESRPAARDTPTVFRSPAPSPIQRDTPRYQPTPRYESTPRYQPTPRYESTPRYQPTPRQQSSPGSVETRRMDSPQRSAPANNGTVNRYYQSDSRAGGGGRSRPVDDGPTARPTENERKPDTGRVRESPQPERSAPVTRDSPRSQPSTPGNSGSPNYRSGRGTGTTGSGTVTRQPSAPAERTPGGNPRVGGSRSGPAQSGSPTSPLTWRPPSRAGGGMSPGAGASGPSTRGTGIGGTSAPGPRGPNYRPAQKGEVHNVPIDRSYRPPAVDRNRWHNGGRRYGGRQFYTIDLGWYDPWYCYNTGFYTGVRYYYPYYYAGPYVSGFYYSPFWCYGNWAPIYIYPERVIVIEKRVYLRDVVEDDYDIYNTAVQSSMRDTMDDIQAAWLDADGGRLLQHINQAIPVRIYQKGTYKYSLEPEDFRDVTKDALNRVETVGFEWTNVEKFSADEVHLEARHTFRDSDGQRHVIRLTYTLEKAQGGWWITESGSEKWTDDI